MSSLEGPVAGALYRFRDQSQAVSTAGGAATITFLPPGGIYWLIERITVATVGAAGTALVYVQAATPQNLVDSALSMPNVADENSPIFVPGQSALIVVFAGAGAAVACTVTIQGLAYPV